MDLDGLDALFAKFERMGDEIEKDVGKIVANNTIEMTEQTLKYEVQRFTKGYWTGYTARNTKTHKESQLHYKTVADSDYAAYLNYGTRYMDATWFMRDSVNKQKPIFLADIERLMK